jgi:coniferyl-aldehyde dehydrogenase
VDHSLTERVQLSLELQRSAFQAEPMPSLATRLDRIERVRRMTRQYAGELAAAISADFGHRAHQETELAEVFTVETTVQHVRRHLRSWMKSRRMPTALHFLPGSNRLLPQPLGVVGVIAPWNYPYQLALNPAIAALAAGNRVLIKPSELTPATSALMTCMVAEHFAPDEMQVIAGDTAVGKAFAALPFDHLLFTGSTAVGRAVAQAAAQHLTPVTLELGGKSPVLVDPSANLALVAERVAFGKLLNAGQTCIAPDYVLAPKAMVAPLAQALGAATRGLYPHIAGNPDYTSIATERHHARLLGLLADAQARGARVLPTHQESSSEGRKLVPHLLLDVRDEMAVMREEIFGPLLPIVGYDSVDEAIAYIQRHERPLALYWFGSDADARQRVLHETHAGGVTINDCLWHIGQEDQPFGGVGASGQGSYHGVWGFHTFSKLKPVFTQPAFAGTRLFYPPYGKTFKRLLALVKKIA